MKFSKTKTLKAKVSTMKNIQRAECFFLLILTYFWSLSSFAQGMDSMSGSCPMWGGMGWTGMILGGLFTAALISALIALTIFLLRRSHSSH